MSEEESQVFRGDGHMEEGEAGRAHAKKPAPKPAAAPVPAAAPAPAAEVVAPEVEAAPAPNPADQDLDFSVDKSTLWQMSEEMKARVSQMASMSASTNQQLDMQEKNLRALQKKNKS
jgi:3-oxoacyl-ACP reductase-like protein